MAVSLRDLLYSKERLEEVAGMLDHVPKPAEVLGVVVEIGLSNDIIMIAGYANGDARLLWDSGGGVLGDMFQFPNIAAAAKHLCSTAQSILRQLPPQSTIPAFPAQDIVRITVLTTAQRYAVEAPGRKLVQPGHLLNATFAAANSLFDELNALQQSANARRQ